jgi:hypothetical protein
MSAKPTIGSIVWFHTGPHHTDTSFAEQPICAAIVTNVLSETCVNLAVFDGNGAAHGKSSVSLIAEGEDAPDGIYCEWPK